jgi:AcrR family transcriptional regulator
VAAVNTSSGPSRRAAKAEHTAQRIIAAARELFADPGYASATIEGIARRADVAVETVYSRFKNKAGLLDAVLGTVVTGAVDPESLLASAPYREVAESRDQRQQIALLAARSRQTLERVATTQRILETVGSREAQEALEAQTAYRVAAQRLAIGLLIENGPLRDGLNIDEASATYSALANPSTFRMLTGTLGWSADRFQTWLAETMERLLLPSTKPGRD